MLWSQLAEAKCWLSGENATKIMFFECPSNVITIFCEPTLQSMIFLSSLPEAKYLPSGEKATELTYAPWPCSVAISLLH
jgi:hypothetical protein